MILDVATLAAVARSLDADAADHLNEAASYARKLHGAPAKTPAWYELHAHVVKHTAAGRALHAAAMALEDVAGESDVFRDARAGKFQS